MIPIFFRSEYNVRVYFKAASQKAVQKAVTEKIVDGLKTPGRKNKTPIKHEVDVEREEVLESPLLNIEGKYNFLS